MTARMDSEGRVLSAGDQVNVERAECVSFCRKHWEEALRRGVEASLKF